MTYAANVGLEVHLQLSTRSKVFCHCSTEFGRDPNSQTCPVCLGLPGSLPVLNELAFEKAIKAALALHCSVAKNMKFDRKNYYYPDLPKNFQISQYDRPLALNGFLKITAGKTDKKIRIKRVHLEEDAGKLFHRHDCSLIDYNRAGIPLLEIVSDPDMSSPDEAYTYLTSLKSLLRYLDVSDCNMEEGSLRCDANISLRKKSSGSLGVKTELKNMNSFKGVKNALEYEIKRQASALDAGEPVVQETRLWNADKGVTVSMRSKEEAHDYRYFPEPDLVPFAISGTLIKRIQIEIPELPREREARFISVYKLPAYDAAVLTREKEVADFFEEAAKAYDHYKSIANWLMGEVSAILNEKNISIDRTKLTPENLAQMARMVDEGAISATTAKVILPDMVGSGCVPDALVARKGLAQISDANRLEEVIAQVIRKNEKTVQDYRSGRKNALIFLVGQVMKETRGKANPKMVNEILRNKLKGTAKKKEGK